MLRTVQYFITVFVVLAVHSITGEAAEIDKLLPIVKTEISGNRARDYTMRLWRYDKWSTLPMWKKSAEEARTIMRERGFDEAEIVETPADGVTTFGDWANPIGWDVKQATLEVIEPPNLPDEYRYLCNYQDNPTSLGNWSAPTPPEGIETELVLLERSTEAEIRKIDARGKIILVSSNSRGLKRHLDPYGIIGIVSDQIEGHSKDHITVNNWLNGWSDTPGGWLMNASDSRKNIRFSISQKKGNYLRNLLRQGIKVKVRAKIDSRYYTDDTLPYVTGCIRGAGSEGEEVLIGGHINEWGASDNAAGASTILEAVGTLNDLILSGKLPRPKRTLRVWLGSEIYGSMAFAAHNLERLQKKTVAAFCCDDGGADYDLLSSAITLVMNPNACPSYTDAVIIEIAKRYYERYYPNRLFKISPYMMADSFWCNPAIGVPTNWIYPKNGGTLHHNSSDTIDKIDPRSLHDAGVLSALFLYFFADAGFEDIPVIAGLTFDRGIEIVHRKSSEMNERLLDVHDGVSLGKLLVEGTEIITYYTDLQKKTLQSIVRLVPNDKKSQAWKYLSNYAEKIEDFGSLLVKQFRDAVNEKSKAESIKIVKYIKKEGSWEREAANIIPKRKKIGTLYFAEIPVKEWQEVTSPPRWWSATNWASASYWWCDGQRNLNEIKRLCELEAGIPVQNFDLIKYYRFLEKYNLVEFVK